MSLVGHSRQLEQVVSGLDVGVTSFLIVGEHGIGKTTFRDEVARRVYGTTGHPDFVVFRSEGRSIGVDLARSVVERSTDLPDSEFKMLSVEDVDRCTPQASDVLLKTVEEGTGSTRFLLTATDASGVPDTIVSRSELVSLKPLSDDEVRRVLSDHGIEDLDRYVLSARGVPGRAIGYATGSVEIIRSRAFEILEKYREVLPHELMDLVGAADGMLFELLEELLVVCIDVVRFGSCGGGPEHDSDPLGELSGRADEMVFVARELSSLYRFYRSSMNLRRHLIATFFRIRLELKERGS